VRSRVDRRELRKGQQDDGGVHAGVTLDGVHLAVPFRQDEVERKVSCQASILSASDGILCELVKEL